MSAVSHLVAGRRGLIGGGAWESKSGTTGAQMTLTAWAQLLEINGGAWD